MFNLFDLIFYAIPRHGGRGQGVDFIIILIRLPSPDL